MYGVSIYQSCFVYNKDLQFLLASIWTVVGSPGNILTFLCVLIIYAASIEVRQAYRQFVGAVVELIGGVVINEEFKEAALAVYKLFGAREEEEKDNYMFIQKK